MFHVGSLSHMQNRLSWVYSFQEREIYHRAMAGVKVIARDNGLCFISTAFPNIPFF